jgi:lysophospholipase L1-like esterase
VRRLPIKYAGRPVNNTLVLLGDSITFNGGRTDYSPNQYQGNGYWCWAQFLLGHLFKFLANLSGTGRTTADMLPFLPNVLAYNPAWVHILLGTNDVGVSFGTSQITTNLAQMLDFFERNGIRVILGTLPPRSGLTAAQFLVQRQVNQWIRVQARTRSNVIVVDYYATLTSQAGTGWATLNYLSAGVNILTSDNTHPIPNGAYLMGQALANAVKAAGVTGGYDVISDDQDATNVMLDAQMQAGGSGSAPTGWNASAVSNGGSVAYTKTARTDLPTRSWQTVTITPSSGGASASMTLTNPNQRPGAWAVGDTIVGFMEVSLSALDQAPATLYQVGCSLGVRFVGGSGQADDLYWVNGSTSYPNHPVVARQGLLRTPPIVIPVGTTAPELILTLGGGGTYNFDRGGILNISRYGLAA